MDRVNRLAGPLPTAGPDTAQDEGTGPHSPTPLLARGLSGVTTGCFYVTILAVLKQMVLWLTRTILMP